MSVSHHSFDLTSPVLLQQSFVSTSLLQRMQATDCSKLVVQMKERAAEDKSKRFFIRDGNVESVERDRGAGGSRDSSSEEGSYESSGEVESEESEYSVDIRD